MISLCHDASGCLTQGGDGGRRDNTLQRDHGQEQMMLSYKEAITSGSNGVSVGTNQNQPGKNKRKMLVYEAQEDTIT